MSSQKNNDTYGFFGIYRWFLSCLVMYWHSGLDIVGYGTPGIIAVLSFFILSGYSMSYALHKSYFGVKKGILKYYLCRILRFYPCYLFVLAVSYLVILLVPDIANKYDEKLVVLADLGEFLANLFIIAPFFFVIDNYESIIIPQSWSLANEIIIWFILPFILKNQKVLFSFFFFAFLFFLIGILSSIEMGKVNLSYVYFNPIGNMFVFCIGILIYKFKYAIPPISRNLFLLFLIIWSILTFVPKLLFPEYSIIIYYLLLAITAFKLCYLSQIESKQMNEKLVKLDKFLGDISYPIFLSHLLITGCLYTIFDIQESDKNFYLLFAIFAITHIFSIVSFYLTDHKINKLREYIKRNRG